MSEFFKGFDIAFNPKDCVATDEEMQEAINNGEKVVTWDKSDGKDCSVTSYFYNGKIFVSEINIEE